MELAGISRVRGMRTLLSLAAGAIALSSTAAYAAELMDEIEVTVQRRAELIQEVPVAVTAYDDEQLRQLQVVETLDIGRLVPNMISHNNTGPATSNNYVIRGLNNTESIATFDPPVGAYIDDIYITRQNANNFGLFDVDRIEVLRGPQGTLFGRNTTGGAVRVILKRPAEEVGGFVEAGIGRYDRYEARGSIDVPINDKVLMKYSAYYAEDEGYVDNPVTGEKINGQDNYGVRAHMLWNINDEVTWDIAVDYIDDEHTNLLNAVDGGSRISNTGLQSGGEPFRGIIANAKQNFNLGNEVQSTSITSVFDWTVGDTSFSVITGWRDLEQQFALDFFDGGGAQGLFSIVNDGVHTAFTQEVKLDMQVNDQFSYVAGLFYLNEDNETDLADVFLGGVAPGGDRFMANTTESFALYAQGDYAVTDELTLTLGIRYTDEDKDIAYRDFTGGNLTTDELNSLGTPTSIETELWTPRIALEWAPNDDVMLYASATRGFKSGGWNARATNPAAIQPFQAEKVWNYEVGARTEWLDNSLRVNVTAFYTDVSAFQLPSAFQINPGDPPTFITRNFADLQNLGLELEVIYAATDNLTVWSNLGYQDNEYESLNASIIQQQQNCLDGLAMGDMTLIGDNCGRGIVTDQGQIAPPVRSPDYTINLGFNYVWEVNSTYEVVPSWYLYAIDDHSVGSNGDPVTDLVEGYSTYNASLALNNVADSWSLVLECKNCNDRTMKVSSLVGTEYFQDPRTWRLSFRKNFGARAN